MDPGGGPGCLNGEKGFVQTFTFIKYCRNGTNCMEL